MKNLKFPEISKNIQQSVFGAYGGAYSDDPMGSHTALDPVYISNDPNYDWGDTFGGEQNDYGDDNEYGSGSSDSGGDDQEQQQVESWDSDDYLDHYNNGNGMNRTLVGTGNFETIRNGNEFTELMERVNDQIEAQIQAHIDGQDPSATIEYDFSNSYDFTSDVFAIGGATVSGVLSGLTFTTGNNGAIGWSGNIHLNFHDVFEDPWDVFDWFDGVWDTGDPYEINEMWTENIGGIMHGAAGDGDYDYGYGY